MFKIVLSILLILFQLGDILLTEKILGAGGEELNPLVKRFGYWIKAPGTVFAIVFGFIISPIIIAPVLAIMIGVCIYNYTVLRRIK